MRTCCGSRSVHTPTCCSRSTRIRRGTARPTSTTRSAWPLEYQGRYSRLTTLLRIFYALPAYVVVYLLTIALYVVAPLSWLCIVIAGRLPAPLARFDHLYLNWQAKLGGLVLLVVDRY